MAKVSHDELRSELKRFPPVHDKISSAGHNTSLVRPGAEYKDGLQLGAECKEADVRDSRSCSS